jgi:hypothetical protein
MKYIKETESEAETTQRQGYGLEYLFQVGERDFSLYHNVQTHPSSYMVGTGGKVAEP